MLTPSYAAHLVEWAAERGVDLRGSSVERVLVAGEPGGGEPAFRAMLEEGWGARVTEAMGIGDIGVSLWGECEEQDGMHLGARGFVHPELIDPETGAAIELEDGASGELVLTHLRHRAAPLLRFRTRDHVQVRTSPCPCGRTGPRVRCVGRTDDMLIVRGVNVFPSAVREVVSAFAPRVSGNILVRPQRAGRQAGSAAAGQRRARRGRGRPTRRSPRRSVRDCAACWSCRRAWSSCRGGASSAASTSRSSSNRSGGELMRKLQSQGVHHITHRRRRPADVDRLLGGRARHAVRVRAAEPRQRVGEPPLLRSGRRPPDHRSSPTRSATPDPRRTPTDPGCVHHVAFSLSQATFHQAVERLDERGISHSGVKDRGFMDSIYFDDPLGLLIELASYRFEPPSRPHPRATCCSRRTGSASRAATTTSTRRTSPMRSRRSSSARGTSLSDDRSPEEPLLTATPTEEQMAAITLNILKPSVNNLTARIFVRAAGLDFEEVDVWGKTGEPEFLRKDPAHLTPMIEEDGLPKGSLWESCAIMQYLCNMHGLDRLYPTDAGRAGDGRQRDVLPDRHAVSARRARHLSGARLPAVSGRGRHVGRRRRRRRRRRSRRRRPRSPSRSTSTARSSSTAGRFIGGDQPSIADIRLAATLEFLRAIDYDFPAWAEEYMAAMEAALGEAYASRPRTYAATSRT